jgi:glycosyltransferase involved in cell wall biosynthesis
MRILHLIPSFGPGGAERQISLIAPDLANSGLDVHIAYRSGGPNLARLEKTGVHLHMLTSSGNHSPLLAWEIFQLVRRLRPDVVQTWLQQMDILGGAAALFNHVPLIISERSSAAAYAPGWKTSLRLRVGRHAACIVANSRGGLDYWRTHLSAERLRLVRNCVTPSDYPTDGPIEDLPSHVAHCHLVLYVGRFSYEKNIPVLVEAFILVARQHPAVVIMMFGEGPERESAQRRIAQVGLSDRIVIAGYNSQLLPWMKRAASCVSVSHFEGQPNVVMEAAAANCPLVLSDIAAHRELFDETSAFLVPADSPSRIADAVLEVVQDPDRARDRAIRARAIAAQWNLPATVVAYQSIYEEAAGAC